MPPREYCASGLMEVGITPKELKFCVFNEQGSLYPCNASQNTIKREWRKDYPDEQSVIEAIQARVANASLWNSLRALLLGKNYEVALPCHACTLLTIKNNKMFCQGNKQYLRQSSPPLD